MYVFTKCSQLLLLKSPCTVLEVRDQVSFFIYISNDVHRCMSETVRTRLCALHRIHTEFCALCSFHKYWHVPAKAKAFS